MYASKGPLAKRRSLVRSYSLGSPFVRCFGGTGAISPTNYGALMVDKVGYNKLSSSEDEEEDDDNGGGGRDVDVNGNADYGDKEEENEPADIIKMATRGSGEVSLPQDSTATLEHISFAAKVRLACEQMLESAKKSSPHLSELFVGTQLLMKVTSTASARPPSSTHHSLSPSPGFVHISSAHHHHHHHHS
ncbi:hypothetical protein L7F22_056038 [Adiantum nelumboides]|nr:hypothetical protein [Adiantum nelumboides]